MKFILFLCLLLFAQCSNTEEFDPPFDISIIQMIPDQEKQFIDREFMGDSFFCYMQTINYFQDGYELLVKLKISPELSGKLEIVTSFFNHIKSPPASFFSIKNGIVDFECENEYLLFAQICENVDHLVLKEGEYYMTLRFKYSNCDFRNGYFAIKLPLLYVTKLDIIDRYKYMHAWMSYGLFFRVIDGKISQSPIHYLPYVWPKEVYDYIEFNYH